MIRVMKAPWASACLLLALASMVASQPFAPSKSRRARQNVCLAQLHVKRTKLATKESTIQDTSVDSDSEGRRRRAPSSSTAKVEARLEGIEKKIDALTSKVDAKQSAAPPQPPSYGPRPRSNLSPPPAPPSPPSPNGAGVPAAPATAAAGKVPVSLTDRW